MKYVTQQTSYISPRRESDGQLAAGVLGGIWQCGQEVRRTVNERTQSGPANVEEQTLSVDNPTVWTPLGGLIQVTEDSDGALHSWIAVEPVKPFGVQYQGVKGSANIGNLD